MLPEYICYLSHLKMIEEVFEDYDTNDDGLDKEELKGGKSLTRRAHALLRAGGPC